jgi:hypothetical protein
VISISKRAVLGIAVAALGSIAAVAPSQASASCSKPINPISCVEGPICTVGNKLGFQCVDSTAATATADRSCTRPLGTSQCLESVICGAAYKVVAAGEPYTDPRIVNCVM